MCAFGTTPALLFHFETGGPELPGRIEVGLKIPKEGGIGSQ